MAWRLMVVDGADTNRFFPLPDSGTRIVGNSHKYADICLNDLYVARCHCEVETDGDHVTVKAVADDKDTRVNGQKISMHVMLPGEVIRVGNSHLRLEPFGSEAADEDDVEELEAVDIDNEVLEVQEVVAVEDVEEVVEAEVVEPETVKDAEPEPVAAARELPYCDWADLDQLTGHTLAHFEIGPMLGRGHHGVVFRARDVQKGRELALKVIGTEFPAESAELVRFGKAIKAISQIHVPHLVRWFAAGRSGPYCWISQELIEGESLVQIMDRSEPPTKNRYRAALKMAIDLAKALDCLFQRKIVHGNLTPANVIIGVDRTTKLNDLMFRQALEGSAWQKEKMEGKLLCELPYLPPERVHPGGYWDGLADIYSLGALVYARLTGQPPIQGKTPGETIALIEQGRPELPQKFVKETPDAFQTVLMKMLARDQEARYQTPADLLDDLNRVLATA